MDKYSYYALYGAALGYSVRESLQGFRVVLCWISLGCKIFRVCNVFLGMYKSYMTYMIYTLFTCRRWFLR